MIKKILFTLFLLIISTTVFSQKQKNNLTFNFQKQSLLKKTKKQVIQYNINKNISLMDITLYKLKARTPEDDYEKSKIFDKPDLSWIKEKNRLEKIFLSAGIFSSVVGFGIFLAGLINLLVPLNAVSIDGEPIDTNQNVYYSLIGVGSGLMAAGAPFIIVGSIRLSLKKRKLKQETNSESDNESQEKDNKNTDNNTMIE